MKVQLLCICALSAAAVHGPLEPRLRPNGMRGTLSLTVSVSGFRNQKGQAIVALFRSKETWLKNDRALRSRTLRITGPSLTVVFDSLEAGTYAASAFHDENANGKLDMHYFPIPGPSEGAGVSNNARKALGPPSWDDAKFTLSDSPKAIEFSIRY